MDTRWIIGPRSLVGVIVGVVAATLMAPVVAHAVDSSPVFITSSDGSTAVNVRDDGSLFVTANEKNPLPVQGTVRTIPEPNQPQLLPHVDVPASAIAAVFPNVFHNDQHFAVTSAIFANNSGASVNVAVFGYGVGGATSCGALPSPLGPDIIVVSVSPHDTVVVPLPQPAIAPKRVFPRNWCTGAGQFTSPASADVQVTLEGYVL